MKFVNLQQKSALNLQAHFFEGEKPNYLHIFLIKGEETKFDKIIKSKVLLPRTGE